MVHVDVRGEICPRPALIVRQQLAEMGPGDTLIVRGDYPPAESNLRRMCDKHGFDVAEGETDFASDAEEFELHVQVTDKATISEG